MSNPINPKKQTMKIHIFLSDINTKTIMIYSFNIISTKVYNSIGYLSQTDILNQDNYGRNNTDLKVQ
jgi:hypothetical protein